ncbi:BglG family transcription antiterminator [Lacrimispora indolis]|uniref:BglG family transcription antiterminator n=1 Tax=Lacrimispora indolis TaxID=69825 RepID=UPI0003F8F364|nr:MULTISPECIES: PTS sugar transporter subunit IIA [Lachnospiraceae]
MLNDRQEKIISLLRSEKKWKTGQELSAILNVSDRTIRYDIERINSSRKTAVIESNIKFGYRFCFRALEEYKGSEEIRIPQTTEQRCLFVIKKLFFCSDKISLFQLSEELCISQNTLEKELRELKKLTDTYESIKILRKKNCVSLEGTEQEKRIFYRDLIIDKRKNNILNLDSLSKEFDGIPVSIISEKLSMLWEKYKYRIRKEEIPKLLISVATSLKRMIRGKYVSKEEVEGWKDMKKRFPLEYRMAEDFFREMERQFIIGKYEGEIIYLASLIAVKREDMILEDQDRIGNPDPDLSLLAEDILQEIKRNFNTNLCDDEELKVRLGALVLQMIVRKRKKIDVSDFYTGEIKGKYPKIFEMAICAGKVIQEKKKIKIDEDDISYLAQYIGASLEKREIRKKYRVLMIYPINQALSSLCVDKIEKVFRERIYIVDCHNFFERKKVLNAKPDLILTTLPLQHDLNILTVQISIFVRIEDEGKIFQALNYLDEKKYQEDFTRGVACIIEKRLFFTGLDFKTPLEVIGFLSQKLVQAGVVDETFQEEVIKREQMSPTSFVYSFAVPHPIFLQSRESKIAVGILEKPIKWGDYSVKLVLMPAISKNGRHNLSTFFEWLGSTANDYQKISCLMKSESYEAFMEKINE